MLREISTALLVSPCRHFAVVKNLGNHKKKKGIYLIIELSSSVTELRVSPEYPHRCFFDATVNLLANKGGDEMPKMTFDRWIALLSLAVMTAQLCVASTS